MFIIRPLLILCAAVSFNLVHAANYYFSATEGDDSRTSQQAQSSATPWKSLAKLNAVMNALNAGDSILFKRGDVFTGSITAGKSGSANLPIIFSAYGTGSKPVISGLSQISGWAPVGGGIWEASCSATNMVNVVLVNGFVREMGRYPNRGAANNGYLNYESFSGNGQITDNELSSSPNWAGGNVVIRKNRWVLDNNAITSHSGNTIQYSSESGYPGSANYGYFIQNHPATLDVPGEWYFKKGTKKLGIYSPSGDPSAWNVQAGVIDVLVAATNVSNLTFDNLSFRGANQYAFNLSGTQHIAVRSCDISFSGIDAVKGAGLNDLTIENSAISYTNNTALDITGSTYVTIRNNKIRCTGIFPGMGKGDSGSYEAILIDGDNELIELNEIDSTGYNPVTFRGNVNIIRNNVIRNFTFVKDDGGGIYTWNNIANAPPTYGSKIISNIVINGTGAGYGTDDTAYAASSGIYMDDNTAGVEITGNTVANCGLHGVYVHNGHEISLQQNTLFNNKSQIKLAHDNYAAYSPVRNMNLNDNIFFSADNYSPLAEFYTSNNDMAEFGTFENNYYCRPSFESYVISTYYVTGNGVVDKAVDLDGWKAMFGKDASSKKSSVNIPSFDYIRFEYNPSATVKMVALEGTYVDVKGNTYSGSVSIPAFSSAILLKQQAPAALCAGAGSVLREQWDNVPGNTIAGVSVQNTPSNVVQLGGALESGNAGDNYSARIRGYICPPQTGSYTFWVAGDDAIDLWLSTDENPANKVRIAYVSSWTHLREWNRYTSQKSKSITLQAGRRYYLEVLQKEGNGGDHVSVAWQLPNGTFEGPMPATYLLPANTAIVKSDQTISFATLSDVTLGDPPFKLSATASSGLDVSFRIISGPASLSANTVSFSDTGLVVIEATQPGNTYYKAADPVTRTFRVLGAGNAPSCSASGTILREQWSNVSGNNIADIPLQVAPSLTSQLTSFEGPSYAGDRYGSRIRGYLCPPYNGYYFFNIAGDDAAELWLSTDDNPANKVKVAYLLTYTNSREWNKFASQKSAQIYLQAGRRYYVEALQKEMEGGDNLAVAWQIPGGTFEAPIPGIRLSPFIASKADQSIIFSRPPDLTLGTAPFTLSATASSGLPVSFRVISGPATLSGNVLSITATGAVAIEASQPGNASYNAAQPVTQTFNVYASTTTPAPTTCSATGTILREQWNNVGGNNISDFSYQDVSTTTAQLALFEAPSDVSDNYASRIRGYICPPKTGNYTFWIAGDDAAELWLSPDDDPAKKVKIAYVLSWTYAREWNRYSTQKSAQIYLEAGKRYYIEALHKEGGGGDNLAVAWQMPDQVFEGPIAGSRLSPFVTVVSTDCPNTGGLLREQWNNIRGSAVADITVQQAPTSFGQVSLFEGPSNINDNYGSRFRGYICPPQTGAYTFWIAGDDAAELWLSNGESASSKTKIAYTSSWTNAREWNRYASQKSVPITLQKGQPYYVEALHKEAEGGDNLAVAWQLPNGVNEAPIPGNRLVPFQLPSPSSSVNRMLVSALPAADADNVTGQPGAASFTAYPDPFATYTSIYLRPAETGAGSVDLFDLNGKLVRHIFKGTLEKEKLRVITLQADGLSNGIYLLRLATAEKVLTRKITVVGR